MPTKELVPEPRSIEIACKDGVTLGGHFWMNSSGRSSGTVIINPATGVAARYYHYYADFLSRNGFDVVTYDYRGIGRSRPERLRGCGYRWRDWGELDFDAVLRFAHAHNPAAPLLVVGHSVGGFLPGLAESGPGIHRMLTVGAQYAYWRDYARSRRASLFVKWHLVMPLLTALVGYFPGRKLGWLEDLPAGVANEWSFRRARMELNYPRETRDEVLRRFAAISAPILAIAVSDDELGTVAAIRRTLQYYRGASPTEVLLAPKDLGFDSIGHFSLFHSRHASGFWPDTLLWLREGVNPWPHRIISSSGDAGNPQQTRLGINIQN